MSSSDDPDAETLQALYPALTKVGEQIHIPSGPLAGHPIVIRRVLTARGGVLFTLRYAGGRMATWKWFD